MPPAAPEDCQQTVVAFRRAALLLATADSSSGTRGQRRDAGRALVALAHLADEGDLRSILSVEAGDAGGQATWTVACYQLGDIAPSELRDFSSVVEAVKTLERCPSPAHMAAELLVSTPAGLRWTALIRAGSDVEFQQPDDSTTSASDDGAVAEALSAWDRRLHRWSQNIGAGIHAVVSPIGVTVAPPAAAPPAAGAWSAGAWSAGAWSAGAAGPVADRSGEPLGPAPMPVPAAPPGVDPVVVAEMGDSLKRLVDAMRLLNNGLSSHDLALGDVLDRIERLEDEVGELRRRFSELAGAGTPASGRRWWRRRSAI